MASTNNATVRPELGKLFVGGLPPYCQECDLRQFFEKYGTVTDIDIRFDSRTNLSRGFGFVTMAEPSMAAAVLDAQKKAPHILLKRQVSVRPLEKGRQPTPQWKLFVGGLASNVTSEDLYKTFAALGTVNECYVVMKSEPRGANSSSPSGDPFDNEARVSRGFGFVAYADVASFDKVLLARKVLVKGKQADIRCAGVPKDVEFPTDGMLHLGGLPKNGSISEDDLKEYFEGGVYGEETIPNDDRVNPIQVTKTTVVSSFLTQKCRGFGFVCFKDPVHAYQALRAKEHRIKGHRIWCRSSAKNSPLGKGKETPSVAKKEGECISGAAEKPGPVRAPFAAEGARGAMNGPGTTKPSDVELMAAALNGGWMNAGGFMNAGGGFMNGPGGFMSPRGGFMNGVHPGFMHPGLMNPGWQSMNMGGLGANMNVSASEGHNVMAASIMAGGQNVMTGPGSNSQASSSPATPSNTPKKKFSLAEHFQTPSVQQQLGMGESGSDANGNSNLGNLGVAALRNLENNGLGSPNNLASALAQANGTGTWNQSSSLSDDLLYSYAAQALKELLNGPTASNGTNELCSRASTRDGSVSQPSSCASDQFNGSANDELNGSASDQLSSQLYSANLVGAGGSPKHLGSGSRAASEDGIAAPAAAWSASDVWQNSYVAKAAELAALEAAYAELAATYMACSSSSLSASRSRIQVS